MPSRENEDDTERQDRLAVSEEVRIRNLVGMAKTMTDIVLNAEALLDEYVTAFLQREQSDAYTLLRKLGMTPEQKFHIAMGYTGIFNVIDCDARIMMAFLRELYRIRAKAGRVSDDKLLGEMSSAYIRTGGYPAQCEIVESPDVFGTVKSITVGFLNFAHDWLATEPVIDDGSEPESEGQP